MARSDMIGKREGSAPSPAVPCAVPKVSRAGLEQLFSTLEVNILRLTECVVSPGFALALMPNELPGIHYSLAGSGRIFWISVGAPWPRAQARVFGASPKAWINARAHFRSAVSKPSVNRW